MKIAVWWQQESWGGVDTHLAALLGGWPDPDDEFTIIHNQGNPGVERIREAIRRRGARTVAVPDWQRPQASLPLRMLRRLALPWRFLRWTGIARRMLEASGPFDAVIADNGAYPGAWTALAALNASARLAIPRRMLLVHHAAATYAFGQRSFERMVDRGVQQWATDIVAVSRATRETLIRLRFFETERNPIRVIHNGVPVPAEVPGERRLRARWGAADGHFVVGMIGRVERYKGHEDVLLALAELPPAARGAVRLVIVGTGSDSELSRLRRIADRLGLAGQIHFAGYMTEDSIEIARNFDLLANVTKDFEGFGLAIAEAMAAGTPVLATAVGGVPEFVTPEVGLLVPPESPGGIACALASALADPAGTRERAARARAHIGRFDAATMARRFQRLLTT